MPTKLICVIGADGTGKTTLAKKLVKEVKQKRLSAKYVWFRLPYFLAFVILGVSKFLGFTKYINNRTGKFTQYDFSRQPLKALFPLVVLVDTLVYYFLKLDIPKTFDTTVICDRWIPDIMIDISIDTKNTDFDETLIGRAFMKLASKATLTVVVDAPDRILQKRRPESVLDPNVTMRRNLYRKYIRKYEIASLNSDHTITESYRKLVEIARGVGLEFAHPEKMYANSPLLTRRSFVIAANWVFQGTLIMTMSERLFRFILEIAMASTFFVVMSHWIPLVENVILSLVIAHTIDWSLNGNFWATQKFFGRESDPKQKMDFLRELEKGKHHQVEAIVLFGSLSRGQFRTTSDLDMRIVRQKGFVGWLRTNIFVLQLRSTSFVKKLPIDLFILDEVEQVYEHIRRDELPVVIYDPNETLKRVSDDVICFEDLITKSK